MTEARLNAANDLNTGLRELRKLAEKATPGPWKASGWNVRTPQFEEFSHGEIRAERDDDATFIAACSPSLLLALTEVAAKAAEYRRLEEAEPAKVDDPARMEWEPQVDEAAVALDDSLARLSVCFSGAHSPEGAA